MGGLDRPGQPLFEPAIDNFDVVVVVGGLALPAELAHEPSGSRDE